MMRRKPSTEQKYALMVSFITIFIARGYYLYFYIDQVQPKVMGIKIIYAMAVLLLPIFIQINSLFFNVRISRRIFVLLCFLTLVWVFALVLPYSPEIVFTDFSNMVVAFYYVYTVSLIVFTVALFIFRMIVCHSNERVFFMRHFLMVIIPLLSLCLMSLNNVLFLLPPYMLTGFVAVATLLIIQDKYSNLSDQALYVVENAVPGPCFVIDEKLLVHDANLSAVQIFPEYLAVRKMLKKPVKANDILLQIIFNSNNDVRTENNIFEVDGKQYQGHCVAIKSDYHFYGYSVVLKDITAQTDVVMKLEKRNEQQKQILRYYEDEISSIQSKLVSGLMQLALVADSETGEHIRRISNYTNVIARQLMLDGKYGNTLTDRYVEILTKVSPLHDIGKMKLGKALGAKVESSTSVFNDSEVQRHVISGAEIIDSLIVNNPEDLFYVLSKEVTLYHHEWWDGEGYPKGLKGYEIPLSARIVAVADIFDNISFRQFKETHKSSFVETFNAIVTYSGKRFDPVIIDSFKNARGKIEKLYNEMVVEDFSVKDGTLYRNGGGVFRKRIFFVTNK